MCIRIENDFSVLDDIIFISLSLFGVSGGVALIVMVPSYHWWLRRRKGIDH